MKDYSQRGEQAVILEFFKGKKYGRFCDIGANDGITFSNTRALALNGWPGTYIEASPKAFSRLQGSIANLMSHVCYASQYLQLALTNYSGTVILKESESILSSKNDVALVSTLNDSEMDRFKSITHYNEVKVPCVTWTEFMRRLSNHKKFDFISIDIEGEELNVLPDMDFDAMETKMVCIEWNSKPELKKEYDKYLSKFKVIYTSAENIIYCR